jgi:cysteine desulfurase
MELACGEMTGRTAHYRARRDRLLAEVPARVSFTHVTGSLDPRRRLANSFSCCFRFVEGEAVLMALDLAGIAASSGSACTSGSLEPSHVMRAMGIPYTAAHGTVRFSLSRYTSEEEVDRVIAAVPPIVAQLRKLSPYWGANGPKAEAFAPSYA